MLSPSVRVLNLMARLWPFVGHGPFLRPGVNKI